MGRSASPVRARKSPRRRSSPRRERSPLRHRRDSIRASSPARDKPSSRTKSPRPTRSVSPLSRSPSPRTKRLRRTEGEREVERNHRSRGDRDAEREVERGSDRNHKSRVDKKAEREGERVTERNHRSSGEKDAYKERVSNREVSPQRRERRSGRHDRSASPTIRHHRTRNRSSSPPVASNGRERDEVTSSRGAEDGDDDYDSVAKMKAAEEALEAKNKQNPSFELSGKLAAETNRVRGITLLFNEPPEARKPDIRWRLYVFKAGEVLNEPLYVHRQSCYLFGRERRVADVPTDHPSCSKQHAVLQFRQVEKEKPDGMLSKQVRPYVMDLGSTNGTFINDNRIEPQRYYELFEKDTIRFGNSSREYVLLHENSSN